MMTKVYAGSATEKTNKPKGKSFMAVVHDGRPDLSYTDYSGRCSEWGNQMTSVSSILYNLIHRPITGEVIVYSSCKNTVDVYNEMVNTKPKQNKDYTEFKHMRIDADTISYCRQLVKYREDFARKGYYVQVEYIEPQFNEAQQLAEQKLRRYLKEIPSMFRSSSKGYTHTQYT